MASTGPDRAHSCRPRSFSRVSTVPITRLPMTRSSPCSAPPSNQPPTHRCPRKDDSPASRGSHQLATDNQNHGARAAIREPWQPGRNASEVTARTRTAIHNRSRRLSRCRVERRHRRQCPDAIQGPRRSRSTSDSPSPVWWSARRPGVGPPVTVIICGEVAGAEMVASTSCFGRQHRPGSPSKARNPNRLRTQACALRHRRQ